MGERGDIQVVARTSLALNKQVPLVVIEVDVQQQLNDIDEVLALFGSDYIAQLVWYVSDFWDYPMIIDP